MSWAAPTTTIVVRIYGEDAEVLDAKADEVRALITGVDGVDGARSNARSRSPRSQVEVDLARAQAAGVKPGDIRRAATTLLGGHHGRATCSRSRRCSTSSCGAHPRSDRAKPTSRNLLIDTPDGGHVRIGDVADVSIVPNPTVIRHESVSTYIDVTADVSGRDVATVARDVDAVLEQVEFPLEHHAEVLGGFEERQATSARFIAIAVAAADRRLPAAPGGVRELAAGRVVVLDAPAGARRWRGGSAARPAATLTLGSIAGLVAVSGSRPGLRSC